MSLWFRSSRATVAWVSGASVVRLTIASRVHSVCSCQRRRISSLSASCFAETVARLLRNQADIGNAIKPFYGAAAGNELTSLLRDHIGIAVQLLHAAKAADSAAFASAKAAWYRNADDIADFLATANPRSWPQAVMRAAMTEHLDQTLAEAAHELNGQYAASVTDYDEIHHHILDMADLLSAGIIRAFPQRFH